MTDEFLRSVSGLTKIGNTHSGAAANLAMAWQPGEGYTGGKSFDESRV
jgi:hypothetical protein